MDQGVDLEADASRYFEYDKRRRPLHPAGRARATAGRSAMPAVYTTASQTTSGCLHLAFGRRLRRTSGRWTPAPRLTARVYWRIFVRYPSNWQGGGGDKLSRATSFVSSSSWAQAMIAHVWSGGDAPYSDYLFIDPASGTDAAGKVLTTTYNDFNHFRWLGTRRRADTALLRSSRTTWHCRRGACAPQRPPGNSNGALRALGGRSARRHAQRIELGRLLLRLRHQRGLHRELLEQGVASGAGAVSRQLRGEPRPIAAAPCSGACAAGYYRSFTRFRRVRCADQPRWPPLDYSRERSPWLHVAASDFDPVAPVFAAEITGAVTRSAAGVSAFGVVRDGGQTGFTFVMEDETGTSPSSSRSPPSPSRFPVNTRSCRPTRSARSTCTAAWYA